MNRLTPKSLFRTRSSRRKSQSRKPFRAYFEALEDRTMLDAGATQLPRRHRGGPDAVGLFRGRRQEQPGHDHLTVYNEQADPETGVLLTDTLEPGVTLLSSTVTLDGTTTTQLPDQSGQNLAWSLGPIQGYDRESVTLTVSLAEPDPAPARHRRARLSPCSTPAPSRTPRPPRRSQPGTVTDPSLLASTPDANTTDPFIQEEAAKLNYDPTADLQLPAHADRLQLVPRLGPRRARHALVERRQRARRRQPGRGPDAHLGHPGAVRLGDAVAEPGPAA